MSEQRREAHRGLAGLNQTWVAAIARARSRVRYMALCRRLLEVGMRPPGASAPAEPPRTSFHMENSRLAPVRRNTEPIAVSQVWSSPELNTSISNMDPKAYPSSSLPDGSSSSPASDGGSGHGQGGGAASGGDNSAELRRLAHQIRCGGRRKPSIGRHHTPEDRKTLEVRGREI